MLKFSNLQTKWCEFQWASDLLFFWGEQLWWPPDHFQQQTSSWTWLMICQRSSFVGFFQMDSQLWLSILCPLCQDWCGTCLKLYLALILVPLRFFASDLGMTTWLRPFPSIGDIFHISAFSYVSFSSSSKLLTLITKWVR